MIIDDKHKIVFVHIPKCAGTTVRQYLQKWDGANSMFTARVDYHPSLGRLDYVHMPLFILNDHFPDEMKKIKEYWSFAIIRDPFERFASSVSQRLRVYGGKPLKEFSMREIELEAIRCIEFLKKYDCQGRCLPPEYIHFQRQVDYIYLNSEKIIDELYSSKEIDQAKKNILDRIGILDGKENEFTESVESVKNKTEVYRFKKLSVLRRLVDPVWSVIRRYVPRTVLNKIKRLVYLESNERMEKFYSDQSISTFVNEYYAQDIYLWLKHKG